MENTSSEIDSLIQLWRDGGKGGKSSKKERLDGVQKERGQCLLSSGLKADIFLQLDSFDFMEVRVYLNFYGNKQQLAWTFNFLILDSWTRNRNIRKC